MFLGKPLPIYAKGSKEKLGTWAAAPRGHQEARETCDIRVSRARHPGQLGKDGKDPPT